MAKYFTEHELTRSNTAVARGIDNTPPPDARGRLAALANKLLDPLREAWGAPLSVNSGYRCPTLNKAVGGSVTSSHLKGEAADITAGSPAKNRQLFDLAVKMQRDGKIRFDQLIDEKNYSWVHISYRAAGNRNQTLHL
jgi:uncharacterized protein YcbK (DUF882 family)